MELTPRTLGEEAPPPPTRRRNRRRWLPLAIIAVALAALGFIVTRGLSDATLYFRNADEAVDQRDSLGTRRFRLQGTVVGEPQRVGDAVEFDVVYDGVSVAVRHVGDPPDLFRPGIPVVLEGRWAPGEDVFDSDRILVRHDEEYRSEEDYERRQREAERGGEIGPGSAPADEPAAGDGG